MSSRVPGPPPELPGFRFLELLGTGGFADVFQYEQLGLGRKVAVKVLLSDITADVQASFEVESSVMAKLSNHPSIVSIYQAGVTADGRPFLVMEYCPPPHLALRVRARPLTVTKALEVAVQLSGAVETAHRLGILHRDIKPANILFTEFGRAALTDFGISVTTVGAQSGEGFGMSVPWAPPEQLTVGAPMGPSGDVYSLAATLYTALVGRAPFSVPGGANDAIAMAPRVRTMALPPTRRPDVPESLERTLRTAMAKSPYERFESALDFARALQRIQAELHHPVTTIDARDEHAIDLSGPEDGGGTRLSGFVSIDPEPAAAPPAPPPPPAQLPQAAPPPFAVPQPAASASPAGPSYAPVVAPAVPVVQPDGMQDHTARSSSPQAPASPPDVDPAAPDSAPGPRRVPPAVIAAAVAVVLVVAGVVWLGQGAPDATTGDDAPTVTNDPGNPIGPDDPAVPRVRVRALDDGRLDITWRVPDHEDGDQYLVVTYDARDQPELDVAEATPVTDPYLTVSDDEPCAAVRVQRDNQYSNGWGKDCL
ncbi:serine/threonine-protein kinase [Nocardioides sp. MH1]|uniref:serine/threonine-protein kinase n=1 Tax=Nocardioides sp. MH1 TaxID=3242490 RepID=UPI0035204AA8